MINTAIARGDRLLAHLPDDVLEPLITEATLQEYPSRSMVQRRGETLSTIHFPLAGMLSIVTLDSSGSAVEVATIGREGMVGVHALFEGGPLPFEVMWQLPGRSLVVELGMLRAQLREHRAIAELAGRFLTALLAQTGQYAGCNRLHGIDQRAAKWLLLCRDRVDGDMFELTQEFFAIMLGVTRPKLSVVQATFQRAGFISYTRGRLTVLDRSALEQQACDCYGIIRTAFEALDPPA